MELQNILTILRRRFWIILGTTLSTTLVVVVGLFFTTPVYTASTTLRAATATGGTIDWVDYDINYTVRLMNTYVNLATSLPVLQELNKSLGLDEPPAITAEIIPETELMKIIVEDSNPELAAEAANALAGILISQRNQEPVKGAETALEFVQEKITSLESEIDQTRLEYEAALRQSMQDEESLSSIRQTLNAFEDDYDTLMDQYQSSSATATASSPTALVTPPAGGAAATIDLETVKLQLGKVEKDIEHARKDYEKIVSQSLVNDQKTTYIVRLLSLKEGTYASLIDQYDRIHLREVMVENPLAVIEPAVVPETPSKPQWALNIILGVLAGLVAGIGLAFIFESLEKNPPALS